jgi:alpha 1,2-mannosyltransferase
MRRRLSWSAFFVISATLLYIWYVAEGGVSIIPLSLSSHLSAPVLLKAQQEFWSAISPALLAAKPQCPPIPKVWGGDLLVGYNASDPNAQRADRLYLNERQLTELRKSHHDFKTHLDQTRYALPFVPGTRGIATTAGGAYLPVAVVSIRMLRETGCSLPVEVFLASANEWDHEICDVLLPSLSARCLILDDIFTSPQAGKPAIHIDKYQYKIMAILFSSFEDVLFLDSDAFPISDPTNLFSWERYKSTGMIRWPDFWFPSESPYFFNIAGLPMPSVQERGGTESGELMYHKPRHTDSLLMALYYNVYGPDFYYTLQAQGNAGEGDKETFLWSQIVFGDDFYSVQQIIKPVGYITASGEWRGSSMAQFDPRNDALVTGNDLGGLHAVGNRRFPPLFLHVNFPKINPATIFLDESFGCAGPTKDTDGRLRRIWIEDEEEANRYFGFDVERRLWSVVRSIACQYEGKFASWEGVTDICANATTYWETVFGRISL